MIGFADGILGRGGRLNAALGERYKIQAPRHPDFNDAEWIKRPARRSRALTGP